MVMTRDELAAMTDDEILAHYRHKHGDPYMSLRTAREMHRAVFRWWHLTASAAKRNNEAQADWPRRPGLITAPRSVGHPGFRPRPDVAVTALHLLSLLEPPKFLPNVQVRRFGLCSRPKSYRPKLTRN